MIELDKSKTNEEEKEISGKTVRCWEKTGRCAERLSYVKGKISLCKKTRKSGKQNKNNYVIIIIIRF